MNSNAYNVYIDEAGDLGVRRGTKWFIITAIIVRKDSEKAIRNVIKGIKTELNLREIHMNTIRDFYKSSFIVDRLSNCDFTFTNVLVDTDQDIPKNSILTYNYLCRILLERVSWFLRDNDSIGDITLSSRGTSRDGELIDYIKEKLLPYENNQIASNHIGKIQSKQASEWDLLQLADVCATSLFRSHQENRYGFVTPCFMSKLKSNLYAYNNNIFSYGLKYYENGMRPDVDYFKQRRLCNKK